MEQSLEVESKWCRVVGDGEEGRKKAVRVEPAVLGDYMSCLGMLGA